MTARKGGFSQVVKRMRVISYDLNSDFSDVGKVLVVCWNLHSLRLIMVLGGRRNILINKDCYSANETTNQAVGG